MAEYDVLILDRYVASNAAYSAARLRQRADGDVVAWVRELEYGRLHLPAPDWQVLLDVPAELAAERAEHRANTEADRGKDAYERDDDLQRRTGEVYSDLPPPIGAAGGWWRARTSYGASLAEPSCWPAHRETPSVVAAFCLDLVTPWTP